MQKKTQNNNLSFGMPLHFLKILDINQEMNGLKTREQFLKFAILLSYQKRINKIFMGFSSLAKLSDKVTIIIMKQT